MKVNCLAVAVVAALALGAPGRAQAGGWKGESMNGSTATQPNAGSALKGFSGTIKGTSITSNVGSSCMQGFSNQCPVGPCNCFTFSGTSTVPKMGPGNATVSVTVDTGKSIASDGGDCLPAYLEFDLSNGKDSESWSGLGTACDNLDGTASLVGGFALEISSIYSAALGQFTLAFRPQSFKVSYKGKGTLF